MAKPVDDTTLERQPTMEPPAAPRGPSAYLLVIAGPSFGEMHRLQGNRSVIGRADTAAIRVLDDGISREHAAVERDGGKNLLVNLGSTNGTFCNGTKIERQELTDGDKISVGASTILKFTYQDQVDERYQKRLASSMAEVNLKHGAWIPILLWQKRLGCMLDRITEPAGVARYVAAVVVAYCAISEVCAASRS